VSGEDRVADVRRSRKGSSVGETDQQTRFREVFDANYHRVLGYALRRTAAPEDAEDVVAETFLTAWRRLDQVPLGSSARPWLYAVARNALANQRRGEARRERLSARLRTERIKPAEERAGHLDVAWVAAAFARLREDDREVLALVAWEGLNPGEIAIVLGCSRNAARIRLHRARRRLTRALEGDQPEAMRPQPLIPVETEQGR
jgi:RNA polymerase sigma factor (sigma-70 family)